MRADNPRQHLAVRVRHSLAVPIALCVATNVETKCALHVIHLCVLAVWNTRQ
jgi:hypothetical protein